MLEICFNVKETELLLNLLEVYCNDHRSETAARLVLDKVKAAYLLY